MVSTFKTTAKFILLIIILLTVIACRYEFPTGDLLHYGNCKDNVNLDALKIDLKDVSTDRECIHYEYDGIKNLYFTHLNADFNCCPPEITADTVIRGNNIVITEMGDGMCDCICLYDLEFVIRNLDPGTYNLAIASVEDLELQIDLAESYSGTICAEREGYPWQ